jgi:DNA-binding NtrC family response regulator
MTEKSKVHVLVVDDDPDFNQSLRQSLAEHGFETYGVTDPRETVGELKNKSYQVVLLDLRMPEKDGATVLREIRKFDSDIGVIIITAYPSIESAIETLKLQAYDYIKKPFRMSDLVDVINRYVRERGIKADPQRQLMMEIGRKMRELRKQKVLTLRQLSNRAGVSLSLISKIERGDCASSLSTLFKLATALNVDIGYFFEEQA